MEPPALSDSTSLANTPRALILHGGSASYMTIWRAAVDGRIPAHRLGGRWFIRDTDLPRIAAAFPASR